PELADPDSYTSRYAHCDVLIVGAGPAGLAAAMAASDDGARVLLVDEQSEPGGGLLDAPDWDELDVMTAALKARDNVTFLSRTAAFGFYHQNFLGLVQRLSDHRAPTGAAGPRERLWRVRAKQVVLATGAIERPLMFPDNDRPGIMLASAARVYLNRYGVKVGHRAVVVTNNNSAYEASFDLASQGVSVAAIVDMRTTVDPALKKRAQALGVEILTGYTAIGATGARRVSGLRVHPGAGGVARAIACDAVLMSGGWTPSIHLYSQAGGAVTWRDDIGAFIPDGTTPLPHIQCIGACNGDLEAAPLAPSHNNQRGKTFVDFQNDVTANDIRLAVREGFHSIEHIKRYTTNGMATDQGKLANINALAIAADAAGLSVPDIGLTTFRPPYTPVTFGALAGHRRGENFDVLRKTPIDAWAADRGAVFEPVGQWRRARYFPAPGEDMRNAVARECRITRQSLGLFDGSTLGKIEVVGPDAGEFLNRLYTNNLANLASGRCRYALMLGENGFIMDDGVVARLADDRFHVTTTTGGAAHVLSMMEDYLQTEWPDLQVWLTSTTEHWAVIALNGPNARAALAPLTEDIDFDNDAFPHMAVRTGIVCGVPARVFRVSFTGELGYEVNVPTGDALNVWEQLTAAGDAFGAVVYGTEAVHVLRAEKGYIIVGQETDGTVIPEDAGMGWAISKVKPDFVGKRSLARPDMTLSNRKQLVGLLTNNPNIVLDEGAQITEAPNTRSIGHVTSSYWSDALQRSIALAMIEGGRDRKGAELVSPMPHLAHAVTVVDPVFIDPDGERLNG
ncbi:MAG: FAD-dependent oxidoreductase, partial [Rhodospirillaceae bacterium]|nr:FAD-dependent oxidoreductase [Rhodospirillaceae bacterium]